MRRKEFLNRAGGILASLPLAASCGRSAETASAGGDGERPNIVLIMADDMGYSDIGCFGGEIETPNIDSLAAGGIRFTRFYNAARCCPTRASLLTGLYPHQAGMGDMVSADSDRAPGPYQGYLNDRCITLAEGLGQAGYRTYMSGKWHVGEAPEYWPRRRGFDRYFGLISGASSYYELIRNQPRKRLMALDDSPWTPPEEGYYMTDAFADHGVRWLEQHQQSHPEEPFFLYLAFTAPHWPLHAPEETVDKYEGRFLDGWDVLRRRRYDRMQQLGILDSSWPLSPRDPEVPPWDSVEGKVYQDRLMAVYAAMVDRMDQGIGRVLEQLRRMGAEENTLVLFLSDNGACHENIEGRRLNDPRTMPGERGSYVAYRRPWANYSNTPFRMFKHWTQEGGISTPLVARWPAGIRSPGSIDRDTTGHVIDFMPTFLEIAGADYPASFEGRTVTPTPGKSLLPALRNGSRQGHDFLYWEHEGNRAVLQGRWKLVAERGAQWELYDMSRDRTELEDLASSMPEKVSDLEARYRQWAREIGVREV